ncbi:prephenate dehydratase [Bhargavaea beijingensis]|uniref:Prephenate dehydratase n=1 Tax=Bhargavaea beijingensis TaxID=426756 RepID=A0ABX9ZBP8_9BACL|nr:prephenate dehydratase [Bhargavaea beijingensis]MCW1927010.1 prephenate dehydratase [Bhargavaea beijingensis]RSK30745.1 prephenate dehydratase [Bhargavaea beijingensis]
MSSARALIEGENGLEKAVTRVAYLGPEASFTHLAADGLFRGDWLMPYTTIPEAIEAVSEDRADYAVVPIENALEGAVSLTVDYLYHEVELYINAEILQPIDQHLMVHPKQADRWEEVESIHSHPQALAQCHKFLHYRFRGVPLIQATSTAGAAKYASDNPDLNIAAIGNRFAAEKYGLKIVQDSINDFHFNRTRFVVLSKRDEEIGKDGCGDKVKSTLMINLPKDNRSGALHQVLSVFAWRRLNLTKIESRPMKTGLGDYFFIVDVDAGKEEQMMKGALEELEALGCIVKPLGTYRTYEIKPAPREH